MATGFLLGTEDETDPDTPGTPAADGGTDLITEIRRAARQIELPAAELTTQPAEATLVNLDTILYTEADTFRTDLDLLGFAVDLRATPTEFTWHHGDGTSQTTSDAGHPHPQHTVSHRYDRVHAGITLSLDVTYTVDYRVDGGSWTTLPDTLTATGPPQALTVRQATPLLVRP